MASPPQLAGQGRHPGQVLPEPRPPRSGGATPFSVLFLQEGVLDAGAMMGHATYFRSVRGVVAAAPGLEARFAGLPPMSRPVRRMAGSLPLLWRADLDLQAVRWHALQALAARRVLRDEMSRGPVDVVDVKSHTIAFGLIREMDRVPVVPVVDATVWDWSAMGIWRPLRRHSRAMVWPSEVAERRLFERAPLVIALTSWARDGVLRCCPSANVAQHHPGLDLEHYRPAPHRERKRPRVLFVGGRFGAKGGHDLLAALGPALGRELDLDVVTAEPVPAITGVRVHRLTTGDPRLVDLYQQADVVCLPTYGDSNPWTILEAMACGAPVVSTTVGAIPELLAGGELGRLHRPGDRAALAAAVRELLADDGARAELGARSRERCERDYDARRQVPSLIELLRAAA